MEIYFVRHGETDWNINHLIQGHADIPLNENGIKQAKEIANKLKDIEFDVCYCSNLQRAKTTASIIVGNKCPIIYDDLFNERFMGALQETRYTSYLDLIKYWDYNLNCSDDGVESIRSLLARGKEALNFIDKSKKRVLVVSHGAFIKAMNFCLVGYDEHTDFNNFYLLNCEYKKYII